ncbi:MAG: glycosyltransferase family 2 protein [Chloroflexi bacterium]|nr:glycosyltransferase family 2 protein [Chloroflexota bacterium]
MIILIEAGLFLIQMILAGMVGYLLVLTSTAFRASRHTKNILQQPQTRFLILVPAHNEAVLLPQLLANLAELDYPKHLFAVHVVADNCTDETAVIGRQHGAIVHERRNPNERGKGYALQWLQQRLWQANEPHDAIVIFDADTVVCPNFLRVMDARLASGEKVIQSFYSVRNPERSWGVGLRYAALAVLHFLRPQGRMVLGASAGLKGNGMVFAADILKNHEWSASVTEDIELHMTLLLAGERVTFAPDAVIWAEMPQKLADARSQNMRWEQGRLQMARKYIPQLMKAAILHKNLSPILYFDAIMEHLIPPFSILVGINGATLLANWALKRSWSKNRIRFVYRNQRKNWGQTLHFLNLITGFVLILGQVVYLLAGLRLVNAPRHIYRTLLFAPLYIIWKIWQYLRVFSGRGEQRWIRTKRNLQ